MTSVLRSHAEEPRTSTAATWRCWHTAIALSVSALGLATRVTNALTIHGHGRISDFSSTVSALEIMAREQQLLDPGGPEHNAYHGPLWYVIAAAVLRFFDKLALPGVERFALPAIVISVGAWLVRQLILNAGMREALPKRPWARVTALSLHAVLPVAVYQDSVLYNEGFHATLFAAALFYLLRIERAGPHAIKSRDAALFGTFTGLGLITKTTSVLLPLGALGLLAAWLWWAGRRWPFVARDVTIPGLWATGTFLLGAGWWCAWNLQRFGHPFPHQYGIRRAAVLAAHPNVAEPLLYHRPLGWFLPFDASLGTPYAEWPRPNFWVQMVAGTWADDINHGFCRMSGGVVRQFWGGALTERCEEVSRQLVHVGLALTLIAVAVCVWLLREAVRTAGARGSLVLPLLGAATVLLLALFGAQYPFDHHPIIKASYALHLAAPLCACVGLALEAGVDRAHDAGTRLARALWIAMPRLVVGGSTAIVGWLVALELWGS
jgi:hypothetical protein